MIVFVYYIWGMIGKYANNLIAIAIAALIFVSCKKDYSCHCTVNTYNPYINTTSKEFTSSKVYGTKHEAKGKCEKKPSEFDTTSYMYTNCILY